MDLPVGFPILMGRFFRHWQRHRKRRVERVSIENFGDVIGMLSAWKYVASVESGARRKALVFRGKLAHAILRSVIRKWNISWNVQRGIYDAANRLRQRMIIEQDV